MLRSLVIGALASFAALITHTAVDRTLVGR